MPAGALPFCLALHSPASAVKIKSIIISIGNHPTNQIAGHSLFISEILLIYYGCCYSSPTFIALVAFRHRHLFVDFFDANFTVLRQCKTKFDCLVYEMLFIKELKPSLNVQSDSLKAKLF